MRCDLGPCTVFIHSEHDTNAPSLVHIKRVPPTSVWVTASGRYALWNSPLAYMVHRNYAAQRKQQTRSLLSSWFSVPRVRLSCQHDWAGKAGKASNSYKQEQNAELTISFVVRGPKHRDAAFLLTVGSFLLTVEPFYLELSILAFLLTIGTFFLLTIFAFLLTFGAFLFTVGKCV